MPEPESGAPLRLPPYRTAGAVLLLAALTAAPVAGAATADTPPATAAPTDGAPPTAGHDAMADAGERLAERVVIPTQARLVDATGRLVEAAAAFERTPDEETARAFRRAWLRAAAAVAAGRAFAFGPIHSLGHDVAFHFPTDEAGVAKTLASLGQASVADIERMRLTPSLTGLDTLAHLLDGAGDAGDVPPATRRYLHALARRVDTAARELLAVWRDGHDGRAPFAEVIATAGAPDNRAYPTAASAAEEIVRGVLDTLDALAGEALPERIERAGAAATDDAAAVLSVLRATVDGAASAYTGAGIAGWLDVDGPTADADIREALASASEALTDAIAGTGEAAASRPALERAVASLERARALLETHALPPTVAGSHARP